MRDLLGDGSPSGSPGGSPPGSPDGDLLRIDPDDLASYLDEAFRVWITEVRPQILPGETNCAGGPPPGTFENTDRAGYEAAIDMNLLSMIEMCRLAIPPMRERGKQATPQQQQAQNPRVSRFS